MKLPTMLVILLSLARFAGAQAPYRDEALHWSVMIPPGWVSTDPETVKAADDEIKSRTSNKNFDYVAGFHPDPKTDVFPYVLVQHTKIPMSGASYEDLEKAFGAREFKKVSRDFVNKSAADLIKSADFGTPRLDRATNRVFLEIKMTAANGIAMRALSVLHLCSTGAIQFNFYARSETFDKDVALLDPFLASFKLDPGTEFVPRSSNSSITFAVSIGVAVGVGLFTLARKRAKEAKA